LRISIDSYPVFSLITQDTTIKKNIQGTLKPKFNNIYTNLSMVCAGRKFHRATAIFVLHYKLTTNKITVENRNI